MTELSEVTEPTSTASSPTTRARHTSHWGAFTVEVNDGRITGVTNHPDDPAPSPLTGNVTGVQHRSRITQPVVRRAWLEQGPGPRRRGGTDEWVALGWDRTLDLVAAEVARVRDEHGNAAIYGGSYGWSSAGRFHHSQSQLHRFFNLVGGSTVGVNTYSNGAAQVILRHVMGSAETVWRRATAWPVVAANTDLLVCFGGIPAKNVSVTPGGITRHVIAGQLADARRRGMKIVLFSPLADDVASDLGAEWLPLRPGTDTAVMLALAQALVAEGHHDEAFLQRCCVGGDRFIAYLQGSEDGQPKTPEWAESISGISADRLRRLADEMAGRRTMINTSWSLQRADHGEQPVWASVALAALLGQIGLPGGGFGNGYGSLADIGGGHTSIAVPALPAGRNTAGSYIPVARIADMLLHPAEDYDFDGERRTYPDTKLVYWVGGNPFHHHQDLNRLRRALGRPDTVVVHDPFWTAMAHHADIVLPATTSLERNDIGAGRNDGYVVAMQQALAPQSQARNDHDIFAGLAERLGVGAAFTEGRDEWQWLQHLYGQLHQRMTSAGLEAPSFEEFWAAGEVKIPDRDDQRVLLADFRGDPDKHRLATPSGRIELYSEVLAAFGYDDCPAHPTWIEPREWLGSAMASRFPLQLVANNPATRLHSQLDHGQNSQASKVQGREPVRVHPDDAAARGIADGDVVRLFNDRGACLAGAVLSAAVRTGVVQLSTGAWYDPDDPDSDQPLCVHGNPNVLTFDRGTSRLAQGCSGQHALVQMERYDGPLPPIRAFRPPAVTRL